MSNEIRTLFHEYIAVIMTNFYYYINPATTIQCILRKFVDFKIIFELEFFLWCNFFLCFSPLNHLFYSQAFFT